MLSGNDERVPLVQWSYVEKREYLVIFINDAGGSFFLHYLAENSRGAVQLLFVTA